jgi:hypothetical protein
LEVSLHTKLFPLNVLVVLDSFVLSLEYLFIVLSASAASSLTGSRNLFVVDCYFVGSCATLYVETGSPSTRHDNGATVRHAHTVDRVALLATRDFSLVLGQCTQVLKDKMKHGPQYTSH